jgi:hypothetical protein
MSNPAAAFAKILGAIICLCFLALGAIFLLVARNAIQKGRVKQRFAKSETLRSENPIRFWLILAPIILAGLVLPAAAAGVAVEIVRLLIQHP